ncbi:MAG: FkbM family methyltransferase [Pirellulaceae bacterium]
MSTQQARHPWWNKFALRLVRRNSLPKASLTAFLCQLSAQGFCPNHIVDVGANRGSWSQKAHRVFPQAGFTLIEPQQEMKHHLDGFQRRCPQARIITAGVSDFVGKLTLCVTPDTVSSGFLHAPKNARQHDWPTREVPVFTLDHLVQQELNLIPDMVKIDAEGMEARIMRGASRLIGHTELFLLEAPLIDPPPGWSSFSELVAMMADFGYEVYEFTHLMRLHGRPATSLLEMAFARRNGFLRGREQSLGKRRAA